MCAGCCVMNIFRARTEQTEQTTKIPPRTFMSVYYWLSLCFSTTEIVSLAPNIKRIAVIAFAGAGAAFKSSISCTRWHMADVTAWPGRPGPCPQWHAVNLIIIGGATLAHPQSVGPVLKSHAFGGRPSSIHRSGSLIPRWRAICI